MRRKKGPGHAEDGDVRGTNPRGQACGRRRLTRRVGNRAARLIVPGLLAIGLSACKEEKKAAPHSAGLDPTAQRVRDAAEQSIRSGAAAAANLRFRGVQVYTQAAPDHYAVCGQVAPFADDANIFVPFVSVVTGQKHGDWMEYQPDQRVGTSTAEASRVYAAIVAYCYEAGGPSPTPSRSAAPTPPLPDAIPEPAVPSPAGRPAATANPPSPAGASGSVTMRQNGNLRTDPHGASIRVVPQGTSLRVFGQAPGGWYQVGDTAPLGWVHESMLDRH